MPPTKLFYYRESPEDVPVLDWLLSLRRSKPRAFAKCIAKIARLAELGHELRRPEADLLRDGVYELRTHEGRVHYRILYFFQDRNVTVLACALTKEDRVPPREIELAIRRRARVLSDPERHLADVEDFE
jgi:phage-related protein